MVTLRMRSSVVRQLVLVGTLIALLISALSATHAAIAPDEISTPSAVTLSNSQEAFDGIEFSPGSNGACHESCAALVDWFGADITGPITSSPDRTDELGAVSPVSVSAPPPR